MPWGTQRPANNLRCHKPHLKGEYRALTNRPQEHRSFSGIFVRNLEEELVKYIVELDARLFGITCTDLRSLAFQLAEKNGFPRNFDRESDLSGKAWFRKFMKDNLSERRSQHKQLVLALSTERMLRNSLTCSCPSKIPNFSLQHVF